MNIRSKYRYSNKVSVSSAGERAANAVLEVAASRCVAQSVVHDAKAKCVAVAGGTVAREGTHAFHRASLCLDVSFG